MFGQSRITILAGHNGSGKTLTAVNLALKLRRETGEKVTAVDMDTVKPYFRMIDAEEELKAACIRIIAPELVKSTVDLPTLPGEMRAVFDGDARCVLDVGGDDAGAIALGQYQAELIRCGYDMYLVVNPYRIFTRTPEAAVDILRDIENASHLAFTGILFNPNLGTETDVDLLRESSGYAERLSVLSGLPVVATAYLNTLIPPKEALIGEPFPIEIYRRRDWVIYDT